MTHYKEHGLSMIELLVALALSSFLILGATQIYIDNRSNYLFQQGQSETMENGRYALLVLERQLAKTGYRRNPDDSFEFAFPAITSGDCSFNAGQTIKKDGDALCLRYQPVNAQELDCASQTHSFTGDLDTPYKPFSESIVERITVTDEALVCNGAELATGITDIRFDFGVGHTNERITYTDTPGKPIRSLRYALLLASERGSRQGMSSQAYEDWHGDAPPDNRLYHISSNSMTLRNLMP